MLRNIFLLIISFLIYYTTKAQDYPEMITVEGGTFILGNNEMDWEKDEQPAHQVTISTFKIAKTETTVAQWKVFCKETGREMHEAPSWGWIDNHPIVNVSYEDAVAYTNWLSEKMDAKYRLPTEAEWEYAARGGKMSKGTYYSGGKSADMLAWFDANSKKQTQPVASKNPNELGIYDMSGNVWEWCIDWYGAYESNAQHNPMGPSIGVERVMRGGGCYGSAELCRVYIRFSSDPTYINSGDGFRVVLSE